MRRSDPMAVLVVFAACTGPGEAVSSLCAAPETTYFSCSVSRGRTIAICGSGHSMLQYRFGRSHAAVELKYPDDPKTGAATMLFAHYSRYRTDRTEVRFENKGIDYSVFDYQEEGKRSAGVRVTTADQKEHQIICAGRIESRLPALKDVLKCDADSALNMGSCP